MRPIRFAVGWQRVLDHCRIQTRHYSRQSDPVRLAMVEKHFGFGPHAWLEMLADRRDLLPLHDLLCRIETAILGILLRVNGISAPSVPPKWIRRQSGRLSIVPDDLANRFERMLTGDPTAARDATRLIDGH